MNIDGDLDDELQLRSLVDFVPWASPRYMRPSHLAPLLEAFELAVEGVPQFVCCSAPPRHAKTESVLHVPAFALRRHPELTLSYSTYADQLSRSKSRKARRLVEAQGIATAGSVNEWRTPEGGGLFAGGVGGPLTGHGVHIGIVDDPYKNRMQAESAAYRSTLSDWVHDVLISRIEPFGSVFIFATRWHPDDLIGEMLGENFRHINLPALSSDEKPLWPERWPLSELLDKRERVGDYTWASLYQGQPRARGNRVFNDVHSFTHPPIVFRAAAGIDTAYSEKKTADYSAWVKMHRHGDTYYVVDAWRGREPAPHFKARIHQIHQGNTAMTWHWYVATSELGAAQLFATPDGAPVHGMVAKADKFIRALKYAAAWNAGKVLVPENAPWLDDFLSEHASFTGVNDKRDDLIDAAVAAFDALATGEENIDSRPARPTRVGGLRALGH